LSKIVKFDPSEEALSQQRRPEKKSERGKEGKNQKMKPLKTFRHVSLTFKLEK
jgi:hypothetical protein